MAEEKKSGKYSGIIRQARQPDDQTEERSQKPDDQQTKQPANQQPGQPVDQKSSKPEKQVNLCVKVPESWRRHWAAHSKLQGVTMTEVMVEALSQKFGLPEDQRTR
ncbi:MAG: hypothetical protein WBA10_04765 [Elainellaceae cyanobacterium]